MSKYYIYGPMVMDDSDIFYNENEAENDMLSCFGNDMNWGSDLYSSIDKSLTDTDYDIFNASRCSANDTKPDAIAAHANDNAVGIKSDLRYYFPLQNGKTSYTDTDYNTLLACIRDYVGGTSNSQLEIVCKVAEVMTGKHFIYGDFRGNGQSDWCYYICPDALIPRLPIIEPIIMGTADMWEIGLEPCESTEDFFEKRDQAGIDLTYNVTTEWREDVIKQWAAGIIGCRPDEVEIIEKGSDADSNYSGYSDDY